MCYAELKMAMKFPYVQSRKYIVKCSLLLTLSLAVWPNVWPPVQSLEDSWGTKMPINIKKNRYSQETRISMTKTYEDPNIFWMSCFLLLVIILFFFFSSFLIFFVFPFYPQKHGFSWSKSSESLTLRIQVCPKKGINPTILLWGWDWDHQTYSREGYGSLGLCHLAFISPSPGPTSSSSIFKRRTKGKREVLEDGVLPGGTGPDLQEASWVRFMDGEYQNLVNWSSSL